MPTFPERTDPVPRIVIEDADPDARQRAARALRRSGYQVAVCGGPDTLSRRRCPLEEGSRCPAVSDADVVISSLPSDDPRQAAVIAAIRERFPTTPVIVEAAPLVAYRHRQLLADCVVLSRFTPTTLPAAVAETLDGR